MTNYRLTYAFCVQLGMYVTHQSALGTGVKKNWKCEIISIALVYHFHSMYEKN